MVLYKCEYCKNTNEKMHRSFFLLGAIYLERNEVGRSVSRSVTVPVQPSKNKGGGWVHTVHFLDGR